MKLFSTVALFSLILSVGLIDCSWCQAQTPVQSDGAVTEETLKSQLRAIGYDIEIIGTGTIKDPTLYLAKVTKGKRSYSVGVQLSGDKTVVWLTVSLAKIEKPELSRGRYQRLMECNYFQGTSFFSYAPTTRILMISRPCDNRGITAKVLEDKIDRLLASMEATRPDWDINWDALEIFMPLPAR